MSDATKLQCPCGAKMNRHAEKIDFSAGISDPGSADADFGGVVAEFHTCADCGHVEEMKVAPGAG